MSNQIAEVSPKYLVEEASNRVPAGYKQTEVGVIPEDWEATTVGHVTSWLSGGTPNRKREDYWQGDIPWISGSTLKTLELETSDQFLTSEGVEAGSKVAPLDATLLLVRGSALHSEIRAGLVVAPLCFNQDVKALIPNRSIVPRYLTIYLLAMESELLKLVSSAGNSAGVLDTELVKNFKFLQPPKHEQTAIANALSDVDALISELEKLIAKKQAIKTATMQQLLTGRTRLSQFALREDGTPKGTKPSELGDIPEDWEPQCLGNYIAALDAGVSVNSVDECNTFPHGKHILKTSCVDRGSFIVTEKKSILPTDLRRAKCSPTKGAIIVSRMNTPALVGEIGYVSCDHPDLFLPDRLWQMRFKGDSSIDARWLSYVLSFPSVAKRIKDAATGTSGSMKNISKSSLMVLELAFPLREEQTAIATILSDMDEEIQALEQRLGKTRQIKQGMMQELLTGKTRLMNA